MDSFEESVGRMLSGLARAGGQSPLQGRLMLGRVLEAGEGTLRVSCGGQELTAADLWFSTGLVSGHWPALESGARVVLFTEDQQDYYLICKAVRL